MRSWDFFDTLLGRACGEPWRVFDLMGGEDFRALRQQAEQKSDKTFEGIYASLKQMTGWSSEKIDAFREQEFDWELKLAFPIRENVSGVRPRDMVITDTYFNAAQIRTLADRIALPEVEIIATYGGKHSGSGWRELRSTKRQVFKHTGDNRHSDYEQAKRFGFPAVHYRAGDVTGLEKTLIAAGHWDVAGLSRCVRLQNPYERSQPGWGAWARQAQYNVPFLLLCAAQLRRYVAQYNHQHVWFLSRDTCLLQRVFQALYPDVSAATFYASRQTYLHPSESFIEYARQAASRPRCLFVDLQGSGKSVTEFTEHTGIKMPYVYCAAPKKLETFIETINPITYYGTELEVFNYDTQGRVIDVVGAQPVRDKVEYSLKSVAPAHAAIDCLLRYIFQPPKAPESDTLQMLFSQIYHHAPRELLRQHQVHHPIVALPPRSRKINGDA